MSQSGSLPTGENTSLTYEIRVRGHLDPRRAAWFGEMQLELLSQGDTLLRGPVADQAALFGLLSRLRDLGLTLVSLNLV